jgi:hypothetical protein
MNNLPTTVTLVAVVGIMTIFLLGIGDLSAMSAFAQSSVEISPTCGPQGGFNFEIIADGFKPRTNVNWQLVDSDENVPLSGYFETNDAGQLRETTFADDLEKGHYKIYFGEDVGNDGKIDVSITPVYAELNIPCKNNKD